MNGYPLSQLYMQAAPFELNVGEVEALPLTSG